jgi:dTDP-4-dehydrorhamnose reductase
MLGLGAERSEVSVVTDQLGCPTWTGHLAPALLELAERRAAGIYHVAGGGSCSWNELAVEVFAQARLDCRVLPTVTDETARPAPRPAYSVLGSERPDTPVLAPWREGVRAHLLAGVRA